MRRARGGRGKIQGETFFGGGDGGERDCVRERYDKREGERAAASSSELEGREREDSSSHKPTD